MDFVQIRRPKRWFSWLVLSILGFFLLAAGFCLGAGLASGGGDAAEQTILRYTYSDDDGHTVLFYHCVTDGTQAGRDALLDQIFDRSKADASEAVDVDGLAGILYRADGLSFLCWSRSSGDSFVLEYDSTDFPDADIIRMAESVR